jgi:prephenate dehydratase
MSAAIALEKPLLIAYLGPEATNTHAAAMKKFGASVDYHAMATIGDIFTAVEKGEADYAVIPIENSTEGSVRETLDSFVESDLKIVAQIYLEITHALISNDAARADHEGVFQGPGAGAVPALAAAAPAARAVDRCAEHLARGADREGQPGARRGGE